MIVIGLALFAFIAGDAWKVLQPHQSHDVGEVNGEALSAQDYQNLVEEYTEVVKFSRGTSALTDEENNQIKDEVWRNYVNNKLIETKRRNLVFQSLKQKFRQSSMQVYTRCCNKLRSVTRKPVLLIKIC